MKRTLLSVTLLLLLSLLLAACAAPAAPAAPAAQATDVPATATSAPTAIEATATQAPAEATATLAEATQGASEAMPAAKDAVVFQLTADQNTARYLVTEQLAGRDLPNDAVGATTQVSGQIVLTPAGGVNAELSKIVVQAGSLATDSSRRDGFVKQNVLQTGQYPEIVFVPTAISGLDNPLTASGPVSFKLTGNLTIRDVTKEITWDVTGTVDGDTAKGTAKTAFKFADFNLTQPKVPIVLSVEDNIRLEMDITLQRVTN